MNRALARLEARIRAAEQRHDVRLLGELQEALEFLRQRLLWQCAGAEPARKGRPL
ncbi:MAG: hypothetical protein PHE83_05770 [Opitutaceae bacterium]|nr:hypothetical protein [Opitutaceae bacterium]